MIQKKFLKILFTSFYSFLLMNTDSFADEATDKAEFKKLYAEFNELYANSDDIDAIIKDGEKLYMLAPKVYGKNHKNTAEVTYTLASLYDKKGKNERNSDEMRAAELYEEYFDISERLKTPYDHEYLTRYFDFVKAEYNANTYKSKNKYSKNLLKIIEKITVSDEEKIEIYITIAKQNFGLRNFKDAKKLFNSAKNIYQEKHGNDHPNVGEMFYWIARSDNRRNKTKDAIKNYNQAIKILDKSDNENDVSMTLTAYKALIHIHSKKGDLDKATPYVIAYAHKRPDKEKQLRDPIYKYSPDTPKIMETKRPGTNVTVIVEFDVDEVGIPNNIFIHSSNSKNVEKIVISAIKKYRYVPYIKNDKLQSMNSFQETFVYTKH